MPLVLEKKHLNYGQIITVTALFVPIAMTFAILVFSEITPKTIGANNWKRLAPFTAKSVQFLLILLMPVIWFLQVYTKKFLMKNNDNKEIFSRADFLAMADIGSSEANLMKSKVNLFIIFYTLKMFKLKTL